MEQLYSLIKYQVASFSQKICLLWLLILGLTVAIFLLSACSRFRVNTPIEKYDPNTGYRGKIMGRPGNSENLLLYLTFSGGGTRAAALSYGVLEAMKKTEVAIDGEKHNLLDEIDAISAVSGGSFTAGYYGLFTDRIFEDFESKFLKKNIEGALFRRMLFNPVNWVRLISPTFDRSDFASEYYDKYVFEGGTFGDIAAQKGPMILINATDMISGIRVAFTQDVFDVFCSDLQSFPVARAAAASSAVPILLTPVTLRNYAGSCGFEIPDEIEAALKERDISKRQYYHANDIKPYLDVDKKPYIHLVDGGVADNLGIRALLDKVLRFGDFWSTLKSVGLEHTHKVVVIVVNAETEVSSKWSLFGKPPPFSAMLNSYSSIAITRYNFETVMLLRERFSRWTKEVQENRCGDKFVSTESGACGDIQFYLIEVKFDALKDEAERTYFKQLPTSFKLPAEDVDKIREVAGRLLNESQEFQRLLWDLK